MSENDAAAEKRTAVDYLAFGSKTAKRVSWEAWKFTVVGSYQIEVTNASYGFEKADHRYLVGVETRDEVAVPAECACPADQYNEEYDCKHKVALATVGGATVLNAAVEYETPAPASSQETPGTFADRLSTDGGTATEPVQQPASTCRNGDARCDGREGDDLPCFACYCDSEQEGQPD